MPEFLRARGRVHHVRFRPGSGNGARAVIFANSLGTDFRIWDDVIAAMPSDMPILCFDKSGHGLSEAGAVTITDFALDLAALMDSLDLSDALVCGVSVGGMIAQALSVQRPDLVAGLVLCNTSYRIGTREFWADRIGAVTDQGLDHMADGILERWFAERFRNAYPDKMAGYRAMLSRTPLAGYVHVCSAILEADLFEDTKRISCPTICVAGSDDLTTPPEIVAALTAEIEGAAYTCLDGVGHLPCIEAPDRLAGLLRSRIEALA